MVWAIGGLWGAIPVCHKWREGSLYRNPPRELSFFRFQPGQYSKCVTALFFSSHPPVLRQNRTPSMNALFPLPTPRSTSSSVNTLKKVRGMILKSLQRDGIALLPPNDVKRTMAMVKKLSIQIDTSMLDPWYNKGVGGIQQYYLKYWGDGI